MIKPIFSVRDSKTGFMAPFVDLNDESAIRGFAYACANEPGIIGFNPADFALYRIGTFDTDTGVIVSDLPVNIYEAVNSYAK